MHEAVQLHLVRLRAVCGALLLSVALYGLVVFLVKAPTPPPLAQGEHLVWVFLALVLVNLVTLMPVYRAMLAGPLRVYRHSHDVQPLLNAHFGAHIVAFGRLEAISILGLALYFVAGRVDWFWIFSGAAAVGMLLLWPAREKVEGLLAASPPTG